MNQSFKLFLCRFFAILNGTWHLFFYSHFCFSAEAIFSIILTTTLVYVNTIPVGFFKRHDKLSGMIWIPFRYVALHFRDRRGAASLLWGNVTRDDSQRQLLAQHCVAMLQLFETTSQQCCNAVLRWKSSLRIVPCNITVRAWNRLEKDGLKNQQGQVL